MESDLAALARSILCVGFSGRTVDTAPLAELEAFAPGGLIVFARNVGSAPELRALVAALRGSGLPPLIAIDQEGGRVARIADPALVAQLPAAMALAAGGSPADVERVARLVGRDLARLGISVDFAPCADLALDPRNTVIGSRSFGDLPDRVGAYVTAFAAGLRRGGVAAALKHFPGHGSTALDSHAELPRVAVAGPTLRARDLVPFAAAISAGAAELVMPAHIVVEALDPSVPATVSAPVLEGLLRSELGFTGAIVTDCLEMDAIAATLGTARGAVRALAAGADLLLISHRLDRAWAAARAIVSAVETGEIPLSRLEAAAGRVRRLRERYARLAPETVELDPSLPLCLAQRAPTVLRGNLALRSERPVTVISFEGVLRDGAGDGSATAPSLSAALRARQWKSELMRVPLEPDSDDIDLLLAQLAALGDRNFVVLTRRAHLIPAQALAVQRMLARVPDAIVISAREPYDAALFDTARHLACIYGDEALSIEGCADALAGLTVPSGRLPVAIGRDAALR